MNIFLFSQRRVKVIYLMYPETMSIMYSVVTRLIIIFVMEVSWFAILGIGGGGFTHSLTHSIPYNNNDNNNNDKKKNKNKNKNKKIEK